MKKTINKPEVKVVKLQKMNVIATSGGGTFKGDGNAESLSDSGYKLKWN